MRRRVALQRVTDESKVYQDTLSDMVDIIRDGPSVPFTNLLEMIRNNVSGQDVNEAIRRVLDVGRDQDMAHTALRDDRDGASLDVSTGEKNMFRAPRSGCLTKEEFKTNGLDMSSLESTPSASGHLRGETEVPCGIPALLLTLKRCTPSEGEDILRRFLVSERSETASSTECEAERPVVGMRPNTAAPGADWHLLRYTGSHLQSESNLTGQVPQVSGFHKQFVFFGPFHLFSFEQQLRRFICGASVVEAGS
jgi:hypothetical protein